LRIEREPKLLPMPRAAISAMPQTVARRVGAVVVLAEDQGRENASSPRRR
jgi:hypothetical protein